MKVLAIDGALGGFSAAIAAEGAIVAARSEPANVALEMGLVALRAVLIDAGLQPVQLDRLAIGTGPGAFTGLRIAIAYAKSLAQAWSLDLVAVSSFDLLEFGTAFDRVLTIVEGRPGVISVRYRDGKKTQRASGRTCDVLSAIAPADARALPVVGASKDVLAELAERGIIVQSHHPRVTPPAAAAALAAATREPARSIHEVSADYGELPAAKIPAF
ncbi:MAG: tRNA (adenosine(37)-N6)-threonylcarbamoyltransferase complex dimerization subunit type 1 TsaB [Candidatus Tumulicola sp.]